MEYEADLLGLVRIVVSPLRDGLFHPHARGSHTTCMGQKTIAVSKSSAREQNQPLSLASGTTGVASVELSSRKTKWKVLFVSALMPPMVLPSSQDFPANIMRC